MWYKNKKITSLLIAGVLVCSFTITPISQTLSVQKAEAVTVWDPGNWVANYGSWIASAASAISSAATSASIGSLAIKEYALDTIAWSLVNIMLKEMIRSVTAWVNSGFEGSPAFITDLTGFLINIADKVAGDFIYGSGLSMLCSPFKLNLQLALGLQYAQTKGYQAKCTLSSVVNNMESFMNGNFLEGGWDGWYNMALTPQNNPYGAAYEAQTALTISLINARGEQTKLLDFGRGFFSMKDSSGKLTTPGAVIETQLNESLGLPANRLTVADELNELVGALFSQLVGQIFSGVGGLLGLTDSSYGDGDYFERLMAERTPTTYTDEDGSGGGITAMQTAITDEEKYVTGLQRIISLINDAETYKDRTYPPQDTDEDGELESNPCHSGVLTSSLSTQRVNAENTLASSLDALDTLEIYVTDYSLLDDSYTATATIATLLETYEQTSIPAAQGVILQDFMIFRSSGALHTEAEYVQLDMGTIPDIEKEIASFTASIDTACRPVDTSGGG